MMQTCARRPTRLVSPFGSLLAVIVLGVTLAAPSFGADVLHTKTLLGDVWLIEDDAGWHIEHPGTGTAALSTAGDAHFTSFGSSGNDHWITAGVEHTGGVMRLALFDGRETARRLPTPTTGSMVATPAVIAGLFGPRSIAWLDGDAHDRLEVRTARWNGWGWSDIDTLAPTAPGSQTGLTGITLADGSGLIVWVAFDGNDDELMWSRFDGEGWSTPQAVSGGNQVPDITPSLVATPDGGALLAWAHYDGHDYRLTLARFDGDAFSAPRSLGPAGAVMPRWRTAGGTSLVIHRTARPGIWVVHEVASDATVLRSLEVDGGVENAPVITGVGPQGIVVRDRAEASTRTHVWSR